MEKRRMGSSNKVPVITGLDLAGCLVGDAARSIAFYRDVLGMTPTDQQERGAEFTLPDGSTFGVWRGDEGDRTSGGCMMFAVDDASEAVALFRERGAQLSDPMETPVCFMSFGEDPDGNVFVIHQRKP
jgi:predicted enzyme related to lactoylglutathione lyase